MIYENLLCIREESESQVFNFTIFISVTEWVMFTTSWFLCKNNGLITIQGQEVCGSASFAANSPTPYRMSFRHQRLKTISCNDEIVVYAFKVPLVFVKNSTWRTDDFKWKSDYTGSIQHIITKCWHRLTIESVVKDFSLLGTKMSIMKSIIFSPYELSHKIVRQYRMDE